MHYQVSDVDRPERFDPVVRAHVLAYVRARVREIAPDQDGNVHVSEVLAAIEDD